MITAVEAFDLYAEDFDNWYDSPEGEVCFHIEIEAIRPLMDNLAHPFLEVGVGTGRFAKELGIEYGIDPSEKVLEIAMKRGVKVKMGRGEKLPFRDETFGAVFLLFTVCFTEHTEKVLSEAKRVLQPGGGIIIGMINRNSPWGEHYSKKKDEGHPIYRYAQFYGIEEIVEMIEKTGMTVQAYSSTLCQKPSTTPYKEEIHDRLVADAGFVCILAKKN